MDAQVAPRVAVIGGVVGCAVAHALARRGVPAILLEAEAASRWARAARTRASCTPASTRRPGELETRADPALGGAARGAARASCGVPVLALRRAAAPAEESEHAAVARDSPSNAAAQRRRGARCARTARWRSRARRSPIPSRSCERSRAPRGAGGATRAAGGTRQRARAGGEGGGARATLEGGSRARARRRQLRGAPTPTSGARWPATSAVRCTRARASSSSSPRPGC